MNVLYFDSNEVWSPQVNDLEDEYQVNHMDEDYFSMSKQSLKRGKWVALHVALLSEPSNLLRIQIDNE